MFATEVSLEEGQLSVNLPMIGELLGLFRVQEEAQCGWNSLIRVALEIRLEMWQGVESGKGLWSFCFKRKRRVKEEV